MILKLNNNVLKISTEQNEEFSTLLLINLGIFIEDNNLQFSDVYKNTISISDFEMNMLEDFINKLDIAKFIMEVG